jgi:hypothetical protein
LKVLGPVVGFLISDVLDERIDVTGTDRERSVTVLPVKRRKVRALILQPQRRFALEFLDQVGDRSRSPELTENMNMVRNPTDAQHWAVEQFAHTAQHAMTFVANGHVVEKWLALFRGENDMQVNLRERLRHGMAPTR